jgi:hypothetical protein
MRNIKFRGLNANEKKWNDDLLGYYAPLEYDENHYTPLGSLTVLVIGNIHENPEMLK